MKKLAYTDVKYYIEKFVILCKDCHIMAHGDIGCRYIDLRKEVCIDG